VRRKVNLRLSLGQVLGKLLRWVSRTGLRMAVKACCTPSSNKTNEMSKIIEIALGEYGVKEVPGDENNPEIMKYYHETGRTWVSSETTPWCDAFADWVVMKAGGKASPGLNARAWLDEGEVSLDFDLKDNYLAILWRGSPSSWTGHVGIPVKRDENYIWLLGGNQSNMVRISAYPIDRLLGYRKIDL